MPLARLPYLRDALSVRPVEYYIIVFQRRIEFIRVSNRRMYEVLLATDDYDSSPEALSRFLTDLKKSGQYFGQPVSVLIGNHQQFAYIRKIGADGPAAALRKLKYLDTDSVALTHTLQKRGKSTYLIAQGIESAFHQSISDVIQTHGLSATSLLTLPVFLFLRLPKGELECGGIVIADFGQGDMSYFVPDKNGGVHYGASDSNATAEELMSSIQAQHATDFDSASVTIYSQQKRAGNPTQPLAGLLMQRMASPRIPASLAGTSGKTPRILQTVTNSMKLFMMICLAVLSLLAVVTGALGLMVDDDEARVGQYQQTYSEFLEVSRVLDSLSTAAQVLAEQQGGGQSKAALTGMLCQTSVNGLYLLGAAVRETSDDTTRVELEGIAKNEAAVFSYNRKLNEVSDPLKFVMSSVRPELVNQQGAVDTLVRFSFYMVVHR